MGQAIEAERKLEACFVPAPGSCLACEHIAVQDTIRARHAYQPVDLRAHRRRFMSVCLRRGAAAVIQMVRVHAVISESYISLLFYLLRMPG
jgi:hypothetical protein